MKCGVCGGKISRTIIPHAVICEDNRKGKSMAELDDLIKQQQESEENNA
jgi:hypothetical protein